MTLLGIGNILQKDDGIGVYAATYLQKNFSFSPPIDIIDGGVEGINLFGVLERSQKLLILDTIELDDTPGSIYLIPSKELGGYGLNSGGAHEIGVLQVLDMLELQGKALPEATVLGIVPHHITFEITLSPTLLDHFDAYIDVALKTIRDGGIEVTKKEESIPLETILSEVRRV
jgi:hydrogenase maturation protease